ncbi:MAG: hypothetical protein RXR18_02600 [Nitrososphaeria archaeon]
MNCLEYLLQNNYDMRGYSPDTYYFLSNTPTSPGECEGLLAYLEATYG